MTTEKELIAEIKSKLKVYDQQGLLDMISIRGWIKQCIKEFGGNVMDDVVRVLIVEKGRCKLPDNFWALKAAVKCEQEGYTKGDDKMEKHPQSVKSYISTTSISDYYNYMEGKPCMDDCDTEFITETLWFETPKKSYNFYYKNPQKLKLVPHTYKIRCDNSCPNYKWESKYTISIDEKHNYLHTNFNNGFLWVNYKGLPVDESNDLVVPETSSNTIEDYIIYYVITKTMEDLLLSNDDPNIANKLQYFENKKRESYTLASMEVTNKGMVGWKEQLRAFNQKRRASYEAMISNI